MPRSSCQECSVAASLFLLKQPGYSSSYCQSWEMSWRFNKNNFIGENEDKEPSLGGASVIATEMFLPDKDSEIESIEISAMQLPCCENEGALRLPTERHAHYINSTITSYNRDFSCSAELEITLITLANPANCSRMFVGWGRYHFYADLFWSSW